MVYSLGQKLVAEFVGTFAVVLVAAGAVALGGDNLLVAALAYGLIVLAFTFAYGDISGAHLNPAVTVGAWIVGAIEAAEAVGYIVLQILGGLVAAFVLAYLLGGVGTGLGGTLLAGGAAADSVTVALTPVRGFVLEAIGAFIVVSAVLHTAVALRVSGSSAAAPVGLAYVAALLFLQPLTGGALNPARAIGPAVATGNFSNLWVFIAGPLAGAAIAALLYKAVLAPSDQRW